MARSVRLTAQALAVAVVVGLLALLIWRVVHDDTATVSKALDQGHHPTAPTFDLERIDGKGRIDLASIRGKKPLVLDFWASWCTPCIQESKRLEAALQKYGNRISFIGVDTKDFSADARKFMRRYHLTYPTVHDGPGDVLPKYGVTGFPETYFVGRDGRLVGERVEGEITAAKLTAGIRRALQT